VDTFL
jgi:hypothetical protein